MLSFIVTFNFFIVYIKLNAVKWFNPCIMDIISSCFSGVVIFSFAPFLWKMFLIHLIHFFERTGHKTIVWFFRELTFGPNTGCMPITSHFENLSIASTGSFLIEVVSINKEFLSICGDTSLITLTTETIGTDTITTSLDFAQSFGFNLLFLDETRTLQPLFWRNKP